MLTDTRVWDVDRVPDDQLVAHRSRELDRLAAALEGIVDEDRPVERVSLTGPPGTGKTMLARLVGQRLHERDPAVQVAYVNCWSTSSRWGVLEAVYESVVGDCNLQRQATARDELARRLAAEVTAPVVAILDEADQLDDLDVLADLFAVPTLTTVAAWNDPDALYDRADGRLESRLRAGVSIPLRPYGEAALTDILERRVEHGLQPGVLGDGTIDRVATVAEGDARLAIRTLAEAADIATRGEARLVLPEHVEEAVGAARAELEAEAEAEATADAEAEAADALGRIEAAEGPES